MRRDMNANDMIPMASNDEARILKLFAEQVDRAPVNAVQPASPRQPLSLKSVRPEPKDRRQRRRRRVRRYMRPA